MARSSSAVLVADVLSAILLAGSPAAAAGTPSPPPATDDGPYRAALLVEAPDLATKVRTFVGHVSWTSTKDESGHLDVDAVVDIPGQMRSTIRFARNTDPTLPADETMEVRFTIPPGGSGDVARISVPQMRAEADQYGEALAGVSVPIVANSFLVGLVGGERASKNLDLLARLPWIDIPLQLAGGKIAKLTFEKGSAGQHAIDVAMASWRGDKGQADKPAGGATDPGR